jgi:histone deacetylase 1/2
LLFIGEQPITQSNNLYPQPPSHTITRSKIGHSRPKKFLDYKVLYSTQHPLKARSSVFDEQEPSSYGKAVTNEHLWTSMGREFDALIVNGTWSLCLKPETFCMVINKWVYKIKRTPDGQIDRYKTQLVAKGFDQQYEIDYFETFSPRIKPSTIRMVLSLAVTFNWPIK